jgi:hypothetical protein
MNTYHLWLHVARLRESSKDFEGADRARRNAVMLPNRILRDMHPSRISQRQYDALSDYGKQWWQHLTKDGKLE